jgi:hypothetical protein
MRYLCFRRPINLKQVSDPKAPGIPDGESTHIMTVKLTLSSITHGLKTTFRVSTKHMPWVTRARVLKLECEHDTVHSLFLN